MNTSIEVSTQQVNFVSIRIWDKFLATITDK